MTERTPTDRSGLYFAVILTAIACMSNCDDINSVERKVNKLEKSLIMREENIIGGKEKDKYYEIGGKIAYVEIDGKPVDQYKLEVPSTNTGR